MKRIVEGKAVIRASSGKVISKDLEVFYNPLMELNRSISLLVLLAWKKDSLIIADPLAGTGIRALRMLAELHSKKISSLQVNDLHKNFKTFWEENAKLSKLSSKKVVLFNTEASVFLLASKGADYIDIDPFGSPNPFLDSAIKKLRRGSILAVTATDTAPLCGTYPKACRRKYWAVPRRDDMMHEAGLRILIRKCQLVGAQYDKALTPLLSYSKDHYFRVYFQVENGKMKVDKILDQHGLWDSAGPLWIGNLHNNVFVNRMKKLNPYESIQPFIDLLAEESKVSIMGFYDIHSHSKELQLKGPPKTEEIIEVLRSKKLLASKTHFTGHGVRSNCSVKQMNEVCKQLEH